MKWEKYVETKEKLLQIPESWLFLHYYEALTVLFRIENALRVFVFSVLKNEFREKWLETNITSDDSTQGTITSIAKRRINQARSFGYLGYSITCPIMHLTSGELIQLITADANWKYFSKYFLGSKDIIKNKLDEIGAIRNSLAHFRPIRQSDIEVVKQNANHVLVAIEKCISEMFGCKNVVPTNTAEDWYKELRTLGTDHCILYFLQSADEEWVKISIEYGCPVVAQFEPSSSYRRYKVLSIISSAILKEFPILSNLITYLTEYVPYSPMTEKTKSPHFTKIIELVLSHKILKDHFKDLRKQIEEVLLLISNETELIKQDNLAKGKIVQVVEVNAIQREATWRIRTQALTCEVGTDDPPEFWGSSGSFSWLGSDFVSRTSKYPWMPTEVSEEPIPF
jgi:hypothetical protein